MAEEGNGPGGGHVSEGPICCYRHPSNVATALCVSCSKPVCGECDRRAGYRHYCPECLPAAPAATPYPYPVPPPPYPYPYPYPVPPLFAPGPPEPQDERERRWWRADWSLRDVSLVMILIFVIYYAVSLVLFLVTDNSFLSGNICYVAIFCPLIALGAWFLARRYGRGRKELGIQWGKPVRTIIYGGLGSLTAMAFSYGALFLIFLIFYLIAGRFPVSGEAERVQDIGGATMALFIVVTVVLAPAFEELLFRGMLYPALRRRLGYKLAIVIDALIFGALHFQPLTLASLVLVGMVLSYLYEATDSLLAPMLAHAFYNAVVIAITLLL